FDIEIGKNIDRRIGEEQRLGIARHVHDEDVTDAPFRAQASLARRHLAHQLVRVEAALHQELAFRLLDELHRLRRRRMAMRNVDDLEATDVETMLAGYGLNFGGRPDKDGNDDAGVRRFDRAAQRRLFARVNDDGPRGGNLLGPGDQPLALRSGGVADRAERRGAAALTVLQHDGLVRFRRTARRGWLFGGGNRSDLHL